MKRAIVVLVLALAAACDGCGAGHHDTPRCSPCARSSDCRAPFACVNAVCETAPPSCHVQIGL
ncbi:MAG TPA: hypothetical protein VHJ20_08120 [Polyangia bacterium]|nr:hypothetical protein [Polyangia bacterium]